MLIISPEQLARFSAQALQVFRVRLREHLCETFPLQTAIATSASIDAFVDLAIAEARATGIRTEATVQSFADHMLLLGVDFQHNPLYATITAPLEDPDLISPIQRMDLVYDRAWAYLDEVRGPDAIHLIHALLRLCLHGVRCRARIRA